MVFDKKAHQVAPFNEESCLRAADHHAAAQTHGHVDDCSSYYPWILKAHGLLVYTRDGRLQDAVQTKAPKYGTNQNILAIGCKLAFGGLEKQGGQGEIGMGQLKLGNFISMVRLKVLSWVKIWF